MSAHHATTSLIDDPDFVERIDDLDPRSPQRPDTQTTLDCLDEGMPLDPYEDEEEAFRRAPVWDAPEEGDGPSFQLPLAAFFVCLMFVGAGLATLIFHARLAQLL